MLFYPKPICYIEGKDNTSYGVLTTESNEDMGRINAYGVIGNASTTSRYVSIVIDNTFEIMDNL